MNISSSQDGTQTYRTLSVNNTTGVVVKAQPGKVHGWSLSNVNAAAVFLKLYDKATAPLATDTPKLTILIPGATTGGKSEMVFHNQGPQFDAGISYRLTGAVADNDATAPTANEQVINLFYK